MWKEIEARVREQLRNDDHEAIILLHQHLYKEMLHSGLRVCLDKDLVKDVIHDVLIGIWTNRHSAGRICNLKGYLLVCLRNNLLRRLSRETRYCSMDDAGTTDFLCEEAADELLLREEQESELRNRVAAALNKLTPRQREIIRLRYYDECSIARIGQITGMETKTVYNTIYSAMKALGAELSVCLLD